MTRPSSSNILPSNKGFTIPLNERFLRYFTDKVDNIMKDLSSGPEDLDNFLNEKQTSFSFILSVLDLLQKMKFKKLLLSLLQLRVLWTPFLLSL